MKLFLTVNESLYVCTRYKELYGTNIGALHSEIIIFKELLVNHESLIVYGLVSIIVLVPT